MASPEEPSDSVRQVNDLFDSLELNAIDTEDFKLFLDHLPIALVISKIIGGDQRIVFANKAYENLTGQSVCDVIGRGWPVLDSFCLEEPPHLPFSRVLAEAEDFLGTFRREPDRSIVVEAYTSLVENDDDTKNYRIVALVDVTEREKAQREELAQQLRDKDMLLKEVQHRVKNNLQLITALIRLDARAQRRGDQVNLDRLAGRIESLQLLYKDLSADGFGSTVDLGHYLSEIAAAVMHVYAVEGIRLDLKVDHAPVSINIAMPAGLLVNELMTNAFKYAFTGASSGTLTLQCLHEAEDWYRIVIADDGIGLPDGVVWPQPGKLGALILQSLQENTQTEFKIDSGPGRGTRVSISLRHKPPLRRPG